ncbi:uncharacterized protein LOC134701166 [Mytilus trossulus]|uniref:uncharacterized protein LOC134701166 n=1 Tax=Mytilus trossulus TaxID=6551 RepID=UPI003004DC67
MSAASKERQARLCNIVQKIFPKVMQKIFKESVSPRGLQVKYQRKHIPIDLTENEISLMEKLPNIDDFTIELCYKILRYENVLHEPSCKWGNVPHDTEVAIGDDVQRILNATNEVISRKSEEISELYYEEFHKRTRDVLKRVDNYLCQDTSIQLYQTIQSYDIDITDMLQQLALMQQVNVIQTVDEDSENIERYSRVSRVIIDTFLNIFRDIIRSNISANKLYQMCLPHLKSFSSDQETVLKDANSSNSYDSMDITLIYKLLRQLSLISPPTNGWGNKPEKADMKLADDVERIRRYRNHLAHRCNTNIGKDEFDDYFDKFRDIGYRMDLNFFNKTNYERLIKLHKTCSMDKQMQTKYMTALKQLENIKLQFENKPIKFFWGESFNQSLMNLRSILKEESSEEEKRKVRVQIIFQTEEEVETTIDILNSLRDEINKDLGGIEFIVATKGMQFENKPIKFFWGESFNQSLMNLRSILKEESSEEEKRKVRVQIIFQTEEEVETTIDILNSLRDEINKDLGGIEFIVATKGSIVLHVEIMIILLETDQLLQSTLTLFLRRILERITTFNTESIDLVLIPVQEFTQWNAPTTMGEPVYLEFDFKAELFKNNIKMEEQFGHILDAIIIRSNGGGTNNNITATVLPICLEKEEASSQSVITEENTTNTEESFTQAQAPVKYNLPVSVSLSKQINIKTHDNENLSITSCIKTGNTLVFTDYNDTRLIICNSDGTNKHHIPLSYTPHYITEIDSNTVAVSCDAYRTILIINISTRSVTSTINTSGYCDGISYNDNNLYVVIDRRSIHVIDLTGKVIRTIPVPSDHITDITVDRNRLVYMDYRTIYCCSLDGKVMWKFKKDEIQDLVRVTTDDEGSVYVTDEETHTVIVVSDDGKHHRELLTQSDGLNRPFGIYFDKKENILLVCNRYGGNAFLFEEKKKPC